MAHVLSLLSLYISVSWTFAQPHTKDLHYVGQFKTENPSFVELLDVSGSNSCDPLDLDLIITNFAESGTNGISAFLDIGRYLRNISNGVSPPRTVLADKTLTWPNFVYLADDGIFPADATLIVHDGFLTPFHTNGGVYILMLNDSKPTGPVIRIEPKTKGCYYHNSTMLDMNGDGLKDILVAQTCQEIGHKEVGTLLWLQQPKTGVTAEHSWVSHELVSGPDILIETTVINSSTVIIYAAQFFSEKLAYYYVRIGVEEPLVLNKNGIVIDDSIGAVYDVKVVDIMKDGRKQLLVNDHLADGSQNGVFLYEFPAKDGYPDPNGQPFTKHQIAANFNTSGGVGVGAPGFALPFDLNVAEDAQGKVPFKIGVAGDGNFLTWELTCTDKETFSYDQEIIQSIGGTSGIMAFGDVDGDGYTEAFVPYYEEGIVYVYTANPEAR